MNRMEVAGSILSNSIEIHAFELGIQLAILMLIIRFYTSKDFSGKFTSILIILVFFFEPVPEISVKPWYFLMGFILIAGLAEAIIHLPTVATIREKIQGFRSRSTNSESET